MSKRRINLAGPGARGVVVNAALLRGVLALLIDGSQRALRMRTQGRSTARGTLPRWISAASNMDIQILEGSTVLEVSAPTLAEADPEEFKQGNLFLEIDPALTAVDYLSASLSAAVDGRGERADQYDKPLLELFRQLDDVFAHNITTISIEAREDHRPTTISISQPQIRTLAELERKFPPPQEVILAGYLNTIRHSDRTFTLVIPSTKEQIKGIAESEQVDRLKSLWGTNVVVAGATHFTSEGKVLRLEASSIRDASERDLQMWSITPEPLGVVPIIRVPQGPRTGLGAIIGRWPGDEPDELIDDALEKMS